MDDPQMHGTIEQHVAEEHELWERESGQCVTLVCAMSGSTFRTSRCTELPP
jgi:hypothetical protein